MDGEKNEKDGRGGAAVRTKQVVHLHAHSSMFHDGFMKLIHFWQSRDGQKPNFRSPMYPLKHLIYPKSLFASNTSLICGRLFGRGNARAAAAHGTSTLSIRLSEDARELGATTSLPRGAAKPERKSLGSQSTLFGRDSVAQATQLSGYVLFLLPEP